MNSKRPNWRRLPIEGICSRITSGGTPLRSNRRFYDGGSIRWVKTGELKDWYIEETDEKITEEAIRESSAKLLPRETVLMAMYGDGRTITSLGILRHESASNQASCAMIANPAVCSPLFLFYSLRAHRHALLKLAYGGAQRNLNAKTIRQFEIVVPPTPIQDRLTSILSAYDDLIENNTRRIKILEEMAQMIYREWFVNFRFPGHEKAKLVESEVGLIPKGWHVGILRDVCDSMDYGYTASAISDPVGPKFLRITDIVPSVIDWHNVPYCPSPDRNAEKYALREGDIVVARTGATTGYAKRLNKRHPASIFASYLVRLRIKPSFSNHLFGVLVESDEYKRFIKANWSGAAQPQANAQVLSSIPILISPEPLQGQFSAIVEPLLDLKEALQFKNLNLRTTRDFLLPKLISGEVPVEVPEEAVLETVG